MQFTRIKLTLTQFLIFPTDASIDNPAVDWFGISWLVKPMLKYIFTKCYTTLVLTTFLVKLQLYSRKRATFFPREVLTLFCKRYCVFLSGPHQPAAILRSCSHPPGGSREGPWQGSCLINPAGGSCTHANVHRSAHGTLTHKHTYCHIVSKSLLELDAEGKRTNISAASCCSQESLIRRR